MSWIEFREEKAPPSFKTRLWAVASKEGGELLGHVKWFSRWRCYSFFPRPSTVFERFCLRDIAQFCETQTKEHRSNV